MPSLATPTIPEQLTAALAEVETLKTTLATTRDELAAANTKAESLGAQVATLISEKAALSGQLVEASKQVAAKDAEIGQLTKANGELAAKEQDLAKRADARAVELMAKVGQPAPTASTPNAGGESADKTALTGVAAIEDNYRKKYGIS